MHKLQLNSPAGDWDSLRAAIFNGADAVYLGVKIFSARRLANNFSMEELKKAVKFAHMHGVKIYLTMNTLVRNEELETWFRTLEEAYLAGIDAVIIQEIWLASLIKKFFPGLQINASTQASLMNYHGINSVKDIDLAVLARELSEDEIKKIRQHTDRQLEIFVHGHLCISYSGQCLISSLIGKRSGNRGVCASSCRKKYNDAGYLLSAKDLMLANKIDRIYGLGIDSVKIEGRMKSPEYVAIATRTYRRQIDSANHMLKLNENQLSHLKMGFNREFTDGFFSGNRTIVGKDMPMNRGIYLGTVSGRELRLESDLKSGDGVGFFNPGKSSRLEGFVLRKMFKNRTLVNNARKGDIVTIPSRHFSEGSKVYLTSKNIGSELDTILRIKEIDIDVFEESGFLNFRSGDLEIKSDILLQEAKMHALSRKDIEEELEKSADIGVKWKLRKFKIAEKRFMPNSRVTKMRKELEEKLIDSYAPMRESRLGILPSITEKKFDFAPRVVVKVYNIEQLKEANEAGAYAIYFDIFSEDFIKAKGLCTNARFFADTPVILTYEDIAKIEKILDFARPDGIAIGNLGLIDTGFRGEKHGKYSLNVFNDISIAALREKDIIPMVSVELNAKQVMRLKNKELIFYSYGQVPVMHFKGEFRERSLRDEKGYSFPLRLVNGNTEMLYSRPIAIYEHAAELAKSGIKYFFLDLQKESKKIITIYKSILEGENSDISHMKQGTTLGNYNKGVA